MEGLDQVIDQLKAVMEQNRQLVEKVNILASQNAEITDQNRKILAQVCSLTSEVRLDKVRQGDIVDQLRSGIFSLSRRVLRVEERVACGG